MPYDKYSGKYFAAANTGQGFVSFFDGIFANISRLYIIKGGSGTGKSRMMKDIADRAEELGYPVGRCLCSADADSLDAVVIPALGVGILDGTAPHVTDPKYPGAVDEIVDVGRFWDKDKLRLHTDKIREMIDRKSLLFNCAYDLLAAAKKSSDTVSRLCERAIDRDKMRSAVSRLTRKWKNGSGYEKNIRILDAFTMKGEIRLDTFYEKAEHIYLLSGRHGAESQFLCEILRIAKEKAQPVFAAPDTVDLSRLCELMLPELGIAFVRCDPDQRAERIINTERFIRPELIRPLKPVITVARRHRRELQKSVNVILSQIRKLHFEIEDIYISTMDFEAKEELTRSLISEIFG